MKLYDSENCPCEHDCSRHAKCKECKEFHHPKEMQTKCETLVIDRGKFRDLPDAEKPFYYFYKP